MDQLFEQVGAAGVNSVELGQTRQDGVPERYRQRRRSADVVGSGATASAKDGRPLAPDSLIVAWHGRLPIGCAGRREHCHLGHRPHLPAHSVLPCRVVYYVEEAPSPRNTKSRAVATPVPAPL